MKTPGLIGSYVQLWKRYVDFGGVTGVADFWWAVLADFIIACVLGSLGQFVGFISYISYLYSLAVLIPSIAICIRRLRDAGYAWQNIFWIFLPIAGWIILVIKFCKPTGSQIQGND
ncbi:MAG: DUF805 domain-containing protein [Clostridia bacterium]|nr:DUF805 domain-containing protein [Clostridia bacterium]